MNKGVLICYVLESVFFCLRLMFSLFVIVNISFLGLEVVFLLDFFILGVNRFKL